MTTVTMLSEVRSVARAQAQEDFEFFANTVLSARLSPKLCEDVQRRVESGEVVMLQDGRHQEVLDAWLCVLGLSSKSLPRSEVLSWLFAEKAA